MLVVDKIHTYYGLSHILFGVSLTVSEKEIVCLLGRNGAGKSTSMRSIMGLTVPKSGNITFRGEKVIGEKPHILARKGITYVPDDRRVFADLSVSENLEISQIDKGPWNANEVYSLFPILKAIRDRKAGCLSGGEQQMLTIARALVTNPDLLLLDEPTEGLAPLIVKEIEEQVVKLRDSGISIFLAEQNVESALKISDRGYVIDNGVIRHDGTVNELRENEEIKRKYLLA
jgi:branched-chain amino acid transport system ATP-binding protein